MRIQIVSDLGPPIFGGAETYVTNLGKQLVSMGNDVSWNYMKTLDASSYELIEGIDCYRSWVPFNNKINLSRLLYSAFMFPKVLKVSRESDIVQFNSFVAATTGWIAGKISAKPYLMMVHEFFGDLWKVVGANFLEKIIYPEVEKFIAKSPYPQIICPSNYSKSTLLGLGVDEKIITVINHGIDHSVFHTGYNPSLKQQLPEKFIIGWSGRIGLSRSKNLKTLLEAFKIVKDKVPNSVLALEGSNFEFLIPHIQSLGLEIGQDVIHYGKSSRENLPSFYSSCDVFASSSLTEGFGFSVVEAQACGTPIVCFNRGSLPEVVRNDETGIVVDDTTPEALSDGISRLYENENLRKNFGVAASEWAKSFTWETSASKHLEVYQNVLNLR